MRGQVNYKGCAIRYSAELGGYYWEGLHYGAESEDIFPSVEAAKADIDRMGAGETSPDDIDAELAGRKIVGEQL